MGLRHYGQDEHLRHALVKSQSGAEPWQQRLFLVPEVGNAHDSKAVMLHTGMPNGKIGSVCAEQAPAIRMLLEEWSKSNGSKGGDVVVCYLDTIETNRSDAVAFTYQVTVGGFRRANERLARKFSAAYQEK